MPLVVGARFALEPGGAGRRCRSGRPCSGAVVGVLGVLAAFTFSAGVSDAAANPARFGQTWQLGTFFGCPARTSGPPAKVLRAVAADPDVTGVDDALIAGAQSGQVSVESFTYDAGGRQAGPGRAHRRADADRARRDRAGPDHGQGDARGHGGTIRLAGGAPPLPFRVTGIGFVPAGPHNDYYDGAWLTPAGYDRLFRGAHYAFKFHVATVSLRPGADVRRSPSGSTPRPRPSRGAAPIAFDTQPTPAEVMALKDVAVLPLALAAFLALLAVAAVGYALSLAVRRRRHELAVLRALGLTRWQSRLVVATQATLLAVIGLAFGIPLGVVLGRTLWRAASRHGPAGLPPAGGALGAGADRAGWPCWWPTCWPPGPATARPGCGPRRSCAPSKPR